MTLALTTSGWGTVEVQSDSSSLIADRRDDLDRHDFRVGHGGAPVREQVGDGVVELLVAYAARHQQVGVVLAFGHAGPQRGAVGQEPLPVGGDHATRGRHQLTQLVERVQDVGIRKDGLADEHRHLTPGLEDLVGAHGSLMGRRGGVEVVVAGIAAELVPQCVDVVFGGQHDGRVRCGHMKSLEDASKAWVRSGTGSAAG